MPILQIRVDLSGIRPPVWRRLRVPGDLTLRGLHETLQASFDWIGHHLWLFQAGRREWDCDPEEGGTESPDRVTLREVAPAPGAKLLYLYDFGDGWEHVIRVEKVLPPDPQLAHPVVVGGKRAAPPDDCGGPWGYAEMLRALADPRHPEHETFREWIGEEWDAEAWDPGEVNERLEGVRAGRLPEPRGRRR